MRRGMIVLLVLLFFLSACQIRVGRLQPPVDTSQVMLWLGDDTLNTGPLDLQTHLMLTEGGLIETELSMARLTGDTFTMAAGPVPEQVRDYVRKHKVDHVVLQAFSSGADVAHDVYFAYAEEWLAFFAAEEVPVVIFYPWRKVDQDWESYHRMVRASLQLSWAEGLTVVPLGDAWQALYEQDQAAPLFAIDQYHASAEGVYLNSLLFYQAFTGKPLSVLSVNTAIGYDQADTISLIAEDRAALLKETAAAVLAGYLERNEFSVRYDLILEK